MLKVIFATIGLLFFLSIAGVAQIIPGSFDVDTFNQLATRAENVVEVGRASTESLEKLRADLVVHRTDALASQKMRTGRVAAIERQVTALGEAPTEGQTEVEEVALRRAELALQLDDVRAPLAIEKEAYLRASGLINEIDKTIRERKASAMLNLNRSPLDPTIWPLAVASIKHRVSQIADKARVHSSNKVVVKLRKQNGLGILFLVVSGLFFMVPAVYWIGRNLAATENKQLSVIDNIKRLSFSFGVFIVPMLGLALLLAAVDLADVFSVRGELLLQSIPMMGVSVFGANWLARNLPERNILNNDEADTFARLISGGRRVILALGVVMALGYLLIGLSNGANWSDDVMSVLRFPLIILLGAGLFFGGHKIKKFRDLLNLEDRDKNIPERMATIFMWACYIAGAGGVVLSIFGYSNAAATLVFAMVQTLALTGAAFIIYAIFVRFFSNFSNLNIAPDQKDEDRPSGGIYKMGLAFALFCISIPILAIIWGARITDISDMWFQMNRGVSMGDTRISISDFLIFLLVFFIGYTITKLLQTVLRTMVFPSTRIESGAQNALVTGFGYVGVFFAGLVAVTTAGLDLSGLAIVAGALSVGIGFGLQTIVSNFVSGIILLIERPVKIGDWVEIGAYMGTVRKISVRSTSIETFDGADVIVPNSDLIAGTVTNYTHGNIRGRLKVPIGVAYGTDTDLVKEVLLSIADEHPMILKNPKPAVMFIGFGADSMDFQLRGILRDVNYVVRAASDINFEIVKQFKVNGIEIPFAQRDVMIKNPEDFFPKVAKPARKPRAKTRPKPKT
ncbi:MAG: mechanosensitive ion channel family protein [Proteobacteria bacterium]|nr:mechanosensitive ion channel family protein [Pseudomonadota bacterium]